MCVTWVEAHWYQILLPLLTKYPDHHLFVFENNDNNTLSSVLIEGGEIKWSTLYKCSAQYMANSNNHES